MERAAHCDGGAARSAGSAPAPHAAPPAFKPSVCLGDAAAYKAQQRAAAHQPAAPGGEGDMAWLGAAAGGGASGVPPAVLDAARLLGPRGGKLLECFDHLNRDRCGMGRPG